MPRWPACAVPLLPCGAARTASSGSGDDCRFFGVYASDGQFAVDASWVDATGANAGVACETVHLRRRSL